MQVSTAPASEGKDDEVTSGDIERLRCCAADREISEIPWVDGDFVSVFEPT